MRRSHRAAATGVLLAAGGALAGQLLPAGPADSTFWEAAILPLGLVLVVASAAAWRSTAATGVVTPSDRQIAADL